LALAEREFGIDVRLCPDMAFALDALPRRQPITDVVILARTDREASLPPAQTEVKTVDWLTDDPSIAIDLERRLRFSNRLPWLRRRLYKRLAFERVRRGCDLLGQGRAVVTDRLHAHILCLLMNIPHVLLDNAYGKLSAFYNTWTRSSPLARFESDFAQAIVKARSLS
jgi:pyruvyl transferase EpsO